MRYTKRFGILDCDGKVVRWVWERPNLPHIVEPVPRKKKIVPAIEVYGPALM